MKKYKIAKVKKIISALLAVVMVFTITANTAFANDLTISQSSVTIEIGQTVKLTANKENTMWVSSDPAVASIDQSGNITGKSKGSTVITVTDGESSAECVVSVVAGTTAGVTRYNVLIIDTSTSIKGKPFTTLQEAAGKFADKVLSADGKNYVAVVALNSNSEEVLGFSDNDSKVREAINGLKAGGRTNMNAAFLTANRLLKAEKGTGSVIRNIVLCSDGLPQTGTKVTSGRYKKSDHRDYAYANATYNTDIKSKNAGYFVYALGFFHNSKDRDLVFGKRLMKDLASKDKYYIITKTDDVDKALDDIANTVTGTTCSKSSVTIHVGESTTIECLVNGVRKAAKWKSADKKVATVNGNGRVTGVKAGKTVITGTYDGQKCECTVTVRKKKAAASIRLNRTSLRVYAGKTEKLKATVTGSSKKVTWKSGNKAVAKVTKKGVVKGIHEGTAYITATANGKTATCKVRVVIRHPEYAQYFMVKTQKATYGGVTKKVNEYGCRLVYNEGGIITKCGVYLEKQSDGSYKRTLACKGKNLTYVRYVPYLAYNGKIVFDGLTTSNINTFSLSQDANGVWSHYGRYSLINANLKNSKGAQIVIRKTGTSLKNTKKFKDLNKMIAWLNK